jgi:uncharacterized protein (TIGR03437 family)
MVQSTLPTWQYPSGAAEAVLSVSPSDLPAGAEAALDITTSGFHFTQTAPVIGFGSPDVLVRKVFVLGDNHVVADVAVAAGAAVTPADVSVLSGVQTALMKSGFRIGAGVAGLPVAVPLLTNVSAGLNGIYAGASISLYGANLVASGGTPVVTFNGEAARILYASASQINLVIPGDLNAGIVTLVANNGAQNSYPVVVSIDSQPAAIQSVLDYSGTALTTAHPAYSGELLVVNLSGFAAPGAVISNDRVQISVAGVNHAPINVMDTGNGVFQVMFALNQTSEVAGAQDAVVVYLDGRSSYPAYIPLSN